MPDPAERNSAPPALGQSGRPGVGYDYDTFAADLHTLMEHLDLRDTVLVGHSMGTGEVTRHLGSYGSARVRKAVLISPIPPFFLAADDNELGAPASMFDGFLAAARADRPALLKGFLENFYNMDVYGGNRVSTAAFDASFAVATSASAIAAVQCVPSWTTDFRSDVASFDVPVLVIQGNQDRVLPIDLTGRRLPALVKELDLVVIEGRPARDRLDPRRRGQRRPRVLPGLTTPLLRRNPMSFLSFRRSAGIAAVALTAGIALVPTASAAPATTSAGTHAKPTIVLVHGAWADGSSWNGVASRLLEHARGAGDCCIERLQMILTRDLPVRGCLPAPYGPFLDVLGRSWTFLDVLGRSWALLGAPGRSGSLLGRRPAPADRDPAVKITCGGSMQQCPPA